MDTTINPQPLTHPFSSTCPGDAFRLPNSHNVYMRLNEPIQGARAVNLETGGMVKFADNEMVQPLFCSGFTMTPKGT